MAKTRGITAKISDELHRQVKVEQEELGSTVSQYIENVLVEHFKHKGKVENNMGPKRTIAFQVSEDFFQRVKSYLRKTNFTQKQFMIGLAENELDRFEMSQKEQGLASNTEGENEDRALNEDGENATESPQEGAWEDEPDNDEVPGEDAAEGQQDGGEELDEDEDGALNEYGENTTKSPQEGAWEDEPDNDEVPGKDATEDQQDADEDGLLNEDGQNATWKDDSSNEEFHVQNDDEFFEDNHDQWDEDAEDNDIGMSGPIM